MAKRTSIPKKGRKVKTIDDLQKEIVAKCLSIRSILESGNSIRLRELESLFSKAMADELGFNHGRFIDKLRNPIKFSMFEIQRFACYTGSDPGKITRLVNEEIKSNTNLQKKLRKFKSVADLKQYNQKKTGRLNRQ